MVYGLSYLSSMYSSSKFYQHYKKYLSDIEKFKIYATITSLALSETLYRHLTSFR